MPSDAFWLIFCIFTCGIFLWPSPIIASMIKEGKTVSCEIEGQKILTNISNGHCFECICRSGITVCTKKACANMSTCPVKEPQKTGVCCEKCKSCSYLGQTYENNDQWFSDQDPCRRFTCKGGVITEGSIDCVVSCKYPVRKPGFCCPVCIQSNEINDVVKKDPCVKCLCEKALPPFWKTNAISFVTNRERPLHESIYCHCFRTPCPVLDCSPEQRHTPPGVCCQECRTSKTVKPLADGCNFRGENFPNLKHFRPELCVLCSCQDGSITCQKFMCKLPNCSANRLYYRPDLCCPLCLDSDPLPCAYGNREYQHGESWDVNSCTRCTCANSQMDCTTTHCPFSQGCPRGHRRVPAQRGQCCHSCKEQDATCTVYGDPHYQTFDGRKYNFQGSCKYILAKSCKRSPVDFMVIVKNEPRGSNFSTWTRQVSIRLEGYRVVLMQGKRIKIDKKLLTRRLPYFDLGKFSLNYDKQQNVIFNSVHGIKVTWDGHSFAEVTLTSLHRKTVCGLCGNYNGDPTDDMEKQKPRHQRHLSTASLLTKNVDEFARSWQTGSWKKCFNVDDRILHRHEDKIRRKLKHSANRFYASKNDLSENFQNGKTRLSDVLQSGNIIWMKKYMEDRGQHRRLVFPLKPRKGADSSFRYSNGPIRNEHRYDYEVPKINANSVTDAVTDLTTDFVKSNAENAGTKFNANLVADTVADFYADFAKMNAKNAVAKRNVRNDTKNPRRKRRRHQREICRRNDEPKRWNLVRQKCKLLKSPLFENCHKMVDVKSFFRSCVEDVCSCPPTGNCHCEVFFAYATLCEDQNVTIDWKKTAECQDDSECPMKGGVFSPCPAPCPPITCANYKNTSAEGSLVKQCHVSHNNLVKGGISRSWNLICIPNCRCPEGTILLLPENRCVQPKNCA